MSSAETGAPNALVRIPLFPLKTVLFPRGRLALRIFEQRYLAMAKRCLGAGAPFGVCLITQGEEVATPGAPDAPEFSRIGTFARIRTWDMPQLGILQISADGGTRFAVHAHELMPDGLVVGDVAAIETEPALAITAERRGLAELLRHLAERIGTQHFPDDHAFNDASWVGNRLAEILPLPPAMEQVLLEMNDADARLSALQRFIDERVAS